MANADALPLTTTDTLPEEAAYTRERKVSNCLKDSDTQGQGIVVCLQGSENKDACTITCPYNWHAPPVSHAYDLACHGCSEDADAL